MAASPEHFNSLITASVVPVVVISSSGLLCLAFYNRLAAIVSRLRGFQRERLEQQERLDRARLAQQAEAVIFHERLIDLLASQTTDVIRRARLIRRALLFYLSAIASMIACSLLYGAAAVAPQAIYLALPSFALGLGLLFAGVVCAFLEMHGSLAPVELESEVVAELAP